MKHIRPMSRKTPARAQGGTDLISLLFNLLNILTLLAQLSAYLPPKEEEDPT
jgi:hypothetical protein